MWSRCGVATVRGCDSTAVELRDTQRMTDYELLQYCILRRILGGVRRICTKVVKGGYLVYLP